MMKYECDALWKNIETLYDLLKSAYEFRYETIRLEKEKIDRSFVSRVPEWPKGSGLGPDG